MSSPPPPTNVETAPPVQEKAAPGEVPPQVPPTTAAPTKVDAYKSRRLRSKHSPLDLVPVLLRILTVVFTHCVCRHFIRLNYVIRLPRLRSRQHNIPLQLLFLLQLSVDRERACFLLRPRHSLSVSLSVE